MCTLEAIVADPQRSHLVRVYVGDEHFLMDAVDLAALQLKVGDPISEETLCRLRSLAELAEAKERALTLLSLRPYTERELGDRLARCAFSTACIEQVVGWLRDLGYLDDAAYAKRWVEERHRTKGLGPIRLRHELKERGVDPAVIEVAVSSIDDAQYERTAFQIAQERLLRQGGEATLKVRRQLYGFLCRRGFSPGTITRVMSRLFDEFPA